MNQGQDNENDNDFPWISLWKIQIIPRIRLFIWKLIQKALPTKSRLAARNSEISPNCPMCNSQEVETETHLFKNFPFARAIWFGCSLDAANTQIFTASIEEWVKTWIEDPNFSMFKEKIATITWFIWKYRCEVVFQQTNPDPIRLIKQINNFMKEANTKDNLLTKKGTKSNRSSWSDFNSDWIIFVDASFKKEDSSMGYDFILYSTDQEAFMHISVGSELAFTTVHAEANTLLRALKWLEENLLSSVTIDTDCKILVDSINNAGEITSRVTENTVEDIMQILKRLPQGKIRHIIRDRNAAADSIAKEARISRSQHKNRHIHQKVKKESIISNIFEKK
ncbi:uncharacterized protein LOC113325286 [Papaver somniferum]|uniref:uncharacterized protein LOC113325286 n=1 Tax=Papaver somniferum TaxID=3469 RepID=UPI000E6F8B52|nr:uncharacterized protein LOC113325286 [Papaver somniferum]